MLREFIPFTRFAVELRMIRAFGEDRPSSGGCSSQYRRFSLYFGCLRPLCGAEVITSLRTIPYWFSMAEETPASIVLWCMVCSPGSLVGWS